MSKSIKSDNPTSEMLAAIEADLHDSLNVYTDRIEPAIQSMIAYHLGWSEGQESTGKRIRPLLTLLCCQAAGGDWRQALPAASAIEWIHNFSLIHDDIQDGSAHRRGRPTVWKVWGAAQAINTGDAIFALARLSSQRLLDLGVQTEQVIELHRLLDETSLALTSGQHLDIAFEGSNEVRTSAYLQMIRGKTAALLGAACQIGAYFSPSSLDRIEAFRSFGVNLGLAFQVRDDLLGVWGVSSETGKSASDDLRAHKKTLPIIHGLENSTDFREMWVNGPAAGEKTDRMRRFLEEAGSQTFTLEWAETFTAEAMSALAAAKALEPAASALTSLAARLLHRIT